MRKRIEVELIHQYRIHLNLPKGITRLVIPADSVEAVCETLRAAADRLEDADAVRVRGEDRGSVPEPGASPAPSKDEVAGGD